jgi:hypothetical protein
MHLTLLTQYRMHDCQCPYLAYVLPPPFLQVVAQPDVQQLGLEESIFIAPATLHLTLLMLKLYSDEARTKAAQALQALAPQVRHRHVSAEASNRGMHACR